MESFGFQAPRLDASNLGLDPGNVESQFRSRDTGIDGEMAVGDAVAVGGDFAPEAYHIEAKDAGHPRLFSLLLTTFQGYGFVESAEFPHGGTVSSPTGNESFRDDRQRSLFCAIRVSQAVGSASYCGSASS